MRWTAADTGRKLMDAMNVMQIDCPSIRHHFQGMTLSDHNEDVLISSITF